MRLTLIFRLTCITFFLVPIVFSEGLEAASSDDYTFMLSPQLVELELLPGEKTKFSVSMINESKAKKARFIVYVSDLGEKRSGKYQVVKPGTSPYSAAGWIKVSPTEFTIGPSDGVEILAEVTVPRGVKGGRYAVIVFELAPEAPSKEEKFGSLTLHHRMTTAVEISIKGRTAKRQAVISSLNVVSAREDKRLAQFRKEVLMFTASLKNEGNIHIFGEGTLTIKSRKGRRMKQVPLGGGRGTVLPDTIVDFSSIVRNDFPAGDYIAEAVIRYEGLRPAQAKLPFTVTARDVPVTKAKSFKPMRELSFGVEPELIELTAPSGALRRTGVVVYNRDDREISVKSYPRALKYNRYGEVVLLSSANAPYSCGEWITITPSSFKLSPGEKKRLSVLVNVPEEEVGGRYANIVFDAVSIQNNPGTSQKTSSNVSFFLTIPGQLEEQARIVETKVLHQDESGHRKFIVSFKNTGNIHLKPGGKILVKKIVNIEKKAEIEYVGEPVYEDAEEIAFNRVDGVVLPGGTRDLTAVYAEELLDGDYSVEAEVDYGDKKKAVGKTTFSTASAEKEVEKEIGKKEEKEAENIFRDIYEKCKQLMKQIIEKDKGEQAK